MRWTIGLGLGAVVAGFAYACGVVMQTSAPAPVRPTPASWGADALTIAYLGHASVLIDFAGMRILTDPTFFDRVGVKVGPWTMGPKRVVRSALTPQGLPPIDAVIVSHAHMDSLDLPSLAALAGAPLLVVPARTKDVVRGLNFGEAIELGWGETVQAGPVTIEAVEVNHWGKRWPWDRWRGYNGYILSRGGVRVLFASDTAYTAGLGEVARARDVTVAILGNGAYDPWIANHASPEQVWRMFEESGARHLIPVHWDTFRLGKEPLGDAMARLLGAAGARAERIVIREIGGTWSMPMATDP